MLQNQNMFFDILIVFIVSLTSSLFVCTGSVQALSKSASSSTDQYVEQIPTTDFSSSLRFLHHEPLASVDYDLGGDISAMLFGQSDSFNNRNNHGVSPSSSSAPKSLSIGKSREPDSLYVQPDRVESLIYRKILSSPDDDRNFDNENEAKHSIVSLIRRSPSINPSQNVDWPSINQPFRTVPVTDSLQSMVDKNPLLRVWLSMLLQKMDESQDSAPFKFGRRRK